jgi:hypothetical protein
MLVMVDRVPVARKLLRTSALPKVSQQIGAPMTKFHTRNAVEH